jgi:hypothetical protein
MKFFQTFTRLPILFLFFPLSSQFILCMAKGILQTSMVYIHFKLYDWHFLIALDREEASEKVEVKLFCYCQDEMCGGSLF